MSVQKQLNIPFSQIPEQGIECEIREMSWFPEDLVTQAGPVTVYICLTKKGDNKVELRGNLEVMVFLECDRCLKQYSFQVNSPMQLVIEVAEEEHWRLQDIESAEVELETITQNEPVVDLAELLRQQLLLALPEKRLCLEMCSGLCLQCGANLNDANCGCSTHSASSPFAILESLKKKK